MNNSSHSHPIENYYLFYRKINPKHHASPRKLENLSRLQALPNDIYCYSVDESLLLSIKSREITLPTKIHIVKAMVFPVVMYGCDSWTIKKAEC